MALNSLLVLMCC